MTDARSFLNPDTMPPSRGYSHVVGVTGGRTIYISGQLALDRDRNVVGPDDLAAQATQVFENLAAALAAAGATFNDVVRLGFYVLDFDNFDVVRQVRDRYVNTEQPPSSTAVAVAGLAQKGLLIEVDAVAVVS